jgi:hypothetical protein
MIPQMQMARERTVILMAPALAHLRAKVKRGPRPALAINSLRPAARQALQCLTFGHTRKRGGPSQAKRSRRVTVRP